MLKQLGNVLYHTRKGIIIAAILLAILMAWYGLGVFGTLSGSNLNDPNSDSTRASNQIKATFDTQSNGGQTNTIILLLTDTHLKATDPAFGQAALQVFNKLKARSEVLSITSYYSTHERSLISKDGHQTFAVINVSTKNGSSTVYHDLQPLFTSPTLQVQAGGDLVTSQEFDDQLFHDLEFAETLTMPVVLLLLIIIFGGLAAASLPLVVGIFSIIGSLALLRVITLFMDVSNFATNVITIIGLGLAIDYSLFIVTRFREELDTHPDDVQKALSITMSTAGRTVIFSGLTVCTSLLSLTVFPETALKSIGLATICAALVAMLGATTVLPAILALLGHHIDALSLSRLVLRKPERERKTQEGFWYQLAQFVMRWSVPITLVVVAVLLSLGIPFLHVAFSTTDERSLPIDASGRIVIEQLRQNFTGQDTSEIDIVIQTTGSPLNSDNLTLLNSYVQKVQDVKHIGNIESVVSLIPGLTVAQYTTLYAHPQTNPALTTAARNLARGNVTRLIVTADLDPHSTQIEDTVRQIRAISAPGNLHPLVGGAAAEEIDQSDSMTAAIPRALLVMAIAIFLLLFLMTGSLVMPIKAMVLNVLSLTATFGALVWIFQDGHLENVFGFQAFGSLDITDPILTFSIAFGLSMDYEVFLLSRIKEQFDRTGNNREAVAVGLQRTGRLITSAALLLAIVIIAFATSRIIFIQEIGVGLTLAVLMDATLVRGLLVPSMMRLMGNANWWAPRPLQIIWEKIGLRESSEEVETDTPDLSSTNVNQGMLATVTSSETVLPATSTVSSREITDDTTVISPDEVVTIDQAAAETDEETLETSLDPIVTISSSLESFSPEITDNEPIDEPDQVISAASKLEASTMDTDQAEMPVSPDQVLMTILTDLDNDKEGELTPS